MIQGAHEHNQQGNDSPFYSYDPVDSPGTLVDIAGTNTGLNNGPTVTDNVTVSIVDNHRFPKLFDLPFVHFPMIILDI